MKKRARRSSLSTMSSFYGCCKPALLSVASENLQQQTRRLKRSEAFFQNRHQAAIDVLIAQTAVAQAKATRCCRPRAMCK